MVRIDSILPVTAADFLQHFRDGNRSELTVYDYGNSYRRFFAKYDALTTENVRAFLRGHTASTRAKYRIHLRALDKFCKAGIDWDAVASPKVSKEAPRVISSKDQSIIAAWLHSKSPVYALAFRLVLLTALRISELMTLTPSDLKQDHNGDWYLNIRKRNGGRSHSKDGRAVPLTPAALAIIHQTGLPVQIKERTFNHYLKMACDQNGIEHYSSHNVRKTCMTRWYDEQGWDIKLIADVAGHQNLNTLLHYLERTPEALRKRMLKKAS